MPSPGIEGRSRHTLASLLKSIGARLPRPEQAEIAVSALVHDSRQVVPGALYVAIRGFTVDGHRFVEAARERGAVAAVVEEEQPSDLVQIRVADTRKALAALSDAWFDRPADALQVFGVTGTNGK